MFRTDSKTPEPFDRRWLVTGAAGFIGSNLVEAMLDLDQHVVGLDNFETGNRQNIEDVLSRVGAERAARFSLVEGDIRDAGVCRSVCGGIDVVLHQAALGSVPRSMKHPVLYQDVNAGGTLNMLEAARQAGVCRFIYASSSSVYGDNQDLPKQEHRTGRPLSPYAASKQTAERYADLYQRCYGLKTIGLRYFNVFGPRQDPSGAYAAVIPKWIGQMLSGNACRINGDGETSRDFCYVQNVVQANIAAALAPDEATGDVYNIAAGGRTTLNELHTMIADSLASPHNGLQICAPEYAPFRDGDIRHSLADVSRATACLGYEPAFDVLQGLKHTVEWYAGILAERPQAALR